MNIIDRIHDIYPFFILLGLLIFVHELGHFAVARFFGVRVETFSLGFGKKIFSFKRGDTTYAISLIPLGGYVKMYGDDPTADVPEAEKKHAFLHKPVMQRIWIVLAGPLMNLFFAILLFALIGAIGKQMPGPFAGDIADGSKAYEAGIRSGDKIVEVGGVATPTWAHVNAEIEKAGGRATQMVIERQGEAQPLKIEVSVPMGDNENIFSKDRQVGQIPGLTQDSRSTLIGVASPESPAAKAGMQTLDVILEVGGQKVNYWRELQPAIFKSISDGRETVELKVREITKSDDASIRTVQIPVAKGWDEKTNLTDMLGFESAELYIFQTKKDSPADKAGIQPKDKVVRIGNDEIHQWQDVLKRVKSFDTTTDGLDFVVLRNGEEKTLKIRPEMTELMTQKGQEEKRFTVGIVSGLLSSAPEPVMYRIPGLIPKLTHGVSEAIRWSEFIIMSLVRLVQGDVSPKNIGGIITIGRVAAHSFAAGLSTFLDMMAIISINLFLLNLLPVPVLDGGHLVFYTYEGLRGAPMSMRKMEIAQQVGLMLLMILMVFAFYNDIANLITNRW
jgi:regulator of sigma E protease